MYIRDMCYDMFIYYTAYTMCMSSYRLHAYTLLYQEGISRARILTLLCAVFERIRRLRKSPQYLLVILHGGNCILRKSPQFSATLPQELPKHIKVLARKMS